jgi:hypothetical protein
MFCVQEDEDGLCAIVPLSIPMPIAEQVDMGPATVSREEFHRILTELTKDFPVRDYNLFNNNCNHFSTRFVKRLTGRDTPRYLTRIT